MRTSPRFHSSLPLKIVPIDGVLADLKVPSLSPRTSPRGEVKDGSYFCHVEAVIHSAWISSSVVFLLIVPDFAKFFMFLIVGCALAAWHARTIALMWAYAINTLILADSRSSSLIHVPFIDLRPLCIGRAFGFFLLLIIANLSISRCAFCLLLLSLPPLAAKIQHQQLHARWSKFEQHPRTLSFHSEICNESLLHNNKLPDQPCQRSEN